MKIGNRAVGKEHPCFVIAEAGVNHNGDLGKALRLIDAAADAGADAVKFQTFKTTRLVTKSAPKAAYQIKNSGNGESQYEMLKRLELSEEAHLQLMAYCIEKELIFMSTPFDELSADLLETLGVLCYKIPSGEIPNLPYLRHIARKGLPMVVSTGMAYLAEVEAAVRALEEVGHADFVLLHCVSNYPADPSDVNLRAMHSMETAFGTLVGYSDHTLGIEVALAAVAMGACVLEKHFTLDRTLPGPDHRASLEPDELKQMIDGIRIVELAKGDGRKRPAASEQNTAAVARKSLVAALDLPAGTVLTEELIGVKRPGTGLAPTMKPILIGRKLTRDIKASSLFELDMVA